MEFTLRYNQFHIDIDTHMWLHSTKVKLYIYIYISSFSFLLGWRGGRRDRGKLWWPGTICNSADDLKQQVTRCYIICKKYFFSRVFHHALYFRKAQGPVCLPVVPSPPLVSVRRSLWLNQSQSSNLALPLKVEMESKLIYSCILRRFQSTPGEYPRSLHGVGNQAIREDLWNIWKRRRQNTIHLQTIFKSEKYPSGKISSCR